MEHKGAILLVEDNKALCTANSRALRLRGYETLTALTLAEARERLAETAPDIILLDVMMPDGDGFSFCEEIRKKTTAHILFLTAKTEHEDKLRGLSYGGDDYITKPFHVEELLMRVDAAMRRRKMDKAPPQSLVRGRLMLDIVASRAYIGGADLNLKPKEYALLLHFLQNEGQVMSAGQLYEKVWRQPMNEDNQAVRKAISRLRPKLEGSGFAIDFEWGEGYRFISV